MVIIYRMKLQNQVVCILRRVDLLVRKCVKTAAKLIPRLPPLRLARL